MDREPKGGVYEEYINRSSPNKDDIERWKRVEKERLASSSSLAYILREIIRDREGVVLMGLGTVATAILLATRY